MVSSTVENGKKRKRDDENEVCFLVVVLEESVSFSIHLLLCIFVLLFLQFWITKQQNFAGKLLQFRVCSTKYLRHPFFLLLLSLTLALLIMLFPPCLFWLVEVTVSEDVFGILIEQCKCIGEHQLSGQWLLFP